MPFDSSRRIYETYNVEQGGRFDMNLHELALGLNSTAMLSDRVHLGFGGGLMIGIADWTSTRVSTWIDAEDETVLSRIEEYAAGQEYPIGALAELRLRWEPSEKSAWFIEAASDGYRVD